jgi:hypothetical protein
MITNETLSLPRSNELRLISFSYNGVVATIVVEDDLGDESIYVLTINTQRLVSNLAAILSVEVDRFRFDVITIKDFLPINENGYYVAPVDTKKMFSSIKRELCSCIGQKASKMPYAVLMQGSMLFCTIIISGAEGVSVIRKTGIDETPAGCPVPI